jgi:hypothetical protein
MQHNLLVGAAAAARARAGGGPHRHDVQALEEVAVKGARADGAQAADVSGRGSPVGAATRVGAPAGRASGARAGGLPAHRLSQLACGQGLPSSCIGSGPSALALESSSVAARGMRTHRRSGGPHVGVLRVVGGRARDLECRVAEAEDRNRPARAGSFVGRAVNALLDFKDGFVSLIDIS